MRLTPARRHALDVLAHTDRHHGVARYSNHTTRPDDPWPGIYWQSADWLVAHGYAVITRHGRERVAITDAGRALHAELGEGAGRCS